MRSSTILLLAAFTTAPLAAQGPVNDVGLALSVGPPTAVVGQVCGPVTCQPFATTAGRGQVLTFVHYSAPISPFALAIGLQGPCRQIPGIGNPLLLAAPVTLQVGLTSNTPTIRTICDQGLAVEVLTVPASIPPGLVVRVQSLGTSNAGPVGFGPAIEVTTL